MFLDHQIGMNCDTENWRNWLKTFSIITDISQFNCFIVFFD